jgi:hypothetical protein
MSETLDLLPGTEIKVVWIDSVMERSWQSIHSLENKLPIYLPTIETVGFYVAHNDDLIMIASSVSHSELAPDIPHFANVTGISRGAIQSLHLDVYSDNNLVNKMWPTNN